MEGLRCELGIIIDGRNDDGNLFLSHSPPIHNRLLMQCINGLLYHQHLLRKMWKTQILMISGRMLVHDRLWHQSMWVADHCAGVYNVIAGLISGLKPRNFKKAK